VGSTNHRLPYTGLANAARFASPNVTDPVITTARGVTTCGPAPTAACRAAYTAAVDALKPMPWASANLRYTQSIGNSNYNALEVKLQRRFTNGLQSLLAYTWGKSIDTSSGFFNVENGDGGSAAVQNYFDMRSARAVSGYDITHFLSWSTLYELPFGKGKKWVQSGPLSWIIGNWQANAILQARTAQPYTIQIGGDPANIGGSTSGFPAGNNTPYARPNLIADPFTPGPVAANPDIRCQFAAGQPFTNPATGLPGVGIAPTSVHNRTNWFNPCAFGVPADGFGTLGRNTYRGPAVSNLDFALYKSFPLPREGWNLRFEAQIFNLFNMQTWASPNTLTVGQGNSTGLGTISGSTFATVGGQTTALANGGQVTALANGTNPRQMQFGLRFQF
jgi:hypothetical protein